MSVLGEKYAVPIITELFDNGGKLKISDFLHLIKNYRTLENITKKLESARIIKITVEEGRYEITYLQLTEIGLEIAPLLKEIIRKLELNDKTEIDN